MCAVLIRIWKIPLFKIPLPWRNKTKQQPWVDILLTVPPPLSMNQKSLLSFLGRDRELMLKEDAAFLQERKMIPSLDGFPALLLHLLCDKREQPPANYYFLYSLLIYPYQVTLCTYFCLYYIDFIYYFIYFERAKKKLLCFSYSLCNFIFNS